MGWTSFSALVEPVGVQFASLSVHQHSLHWILPIVCEGSSQTKRGREEEKVRESKTKSKRVRE